MAITNMDVQYTCQVDKADKLILNTGEQELYIAVCGVQGPHSVVLSKDDALAMAKHIINKYSE